MRKPSHVSPPAIVAIPAHDEAERIRGCLAALAMQRDSSGMPLASGSFSVLLLANNCRDATCEVARAFAEVAPFPLDVVDCHLPPSEAHAGGARRAAMDRAANILEADGARDGVILTTDADSRAQPTWVAATLAGFTPGIDAVAGYIDADAEEYLALGGGFLQRGRLEDRYLSRVAELYALLDPRRHDPWPNHRVHSGAAIAVTLSAYRAIGGLPVRPLGEDSALAAGSRRSRFPDPPQHGCRRDDVMPVRQPGARRCRRYDAGPPRRSRGALRWRSRTRRQAVPSCPGSGGAAPPACRVDASARISSWRRRLGLDRTRRPSSSSRRHAVPFARLWRNVEAKSPALPLGSPLRPSDLPREIEAIERLLRRLTRLTRLRSEGPIDIQSLAEPRPDAIAVPLPR